MNGEAIITVSAAVVALVQLVKWAGLPDKFGAIVVIVLAAAGVALWVWTQAYADLRPLAFDLFAAWIAVATSAAGVFGFSRAVSGAMVTRGTSPPEGAAQHPTVKL